MYLDHWYWDGWRDGRGYAYTRARRRVAREIMGLYASKAPRNIVVDHLCLKPWCVNPAHLEVVTQGENIRRGAAVRQPACRNCRNKEWKIRPGNGRRYCAPCQDQSNERSRRRRVALST